MNRFLGGDSRFAWSAVDRAVHMGPRVLINGTWYNLFQLPSALELIERGQIPRSRYDALKA